MVPFKANLGQISRRVTKILKLRGLLRICLVKAAVNKSRVCRESDHPSTRVTVLEDSEGDDYDSDLEHRRMKRKKSSMKKMRPRKVSLVLWMAKMGHLMIEIAEGEGRGLAVIQRY